MIATSIVVDDMDKKIELLFIADFNKAGTNRFVTHLLDPFDDDRTVCGLYWREMRGDIQFTDVKSPGCLRCRRALVYEYNGNNRIDWDAVDGQV